MLASNPLIQVIPGLMIWTIVCFLVVLFVLKRYAFGPVQQMIDTRRERIQSALDEADASRAEARNLLEEHKKLIGQAKSESEEILSEARRIADAQRERVKVETEEDRQRRLEETRRQIEQATAQALGQIRDEVGKLSLLAAEKITRKSLTGDDQQRLIDEALAEIDFTQLEGSRSQRSHTASMRARSSRPRRPTGISTRCTASSASFATPSTAPRTLARCSRTRRSTRS
jgi:F-type H+-transporting ATPase subunit b